jgi:N-methylhydantoinase B
VSARDYDPVLAQVIQRRLEVICQEAAITLNRTSGSPIVTEANDFSTSLLDPEGETIAFSSYLPPHFVSGINAMRDLIETIDLDDVRPGDHFGANDPHTTASLHSADTNVMTPLFYDGEVVAWAFSDVHVFDIGGLTPGGWIPGAFDRYGEGLHFPVMKIVREGVWDETFVNIFLANVRLPQSLNDLRSCVAANNTAQQRLEEALDRHGVDDFRRYSAINVALSEELARERVAALPDGIYEATDWVEYDGHGVDGLYRLTVRLVARGDELLVDLRDSPPQVDGFVNATRAGLLGWIVGDLVRNLFPDLPINGGIVRPLRILRSEPGTMLNPTRDAATSGGHMEAGSKVMRAFHEALQKAIQLSESPLIRRRAAALGGSVAPHNVVAGTDDEGNPAVWVSLDSLGTGLGAQFNVDGRDAGCYEDMTGSMLLDTELEESAPALHFYRRLLPNSGGHGYRRGGLAVDTAWCLYGMSESRVTMLSNLTRIPTRSPGGGLPGSATGNLIFREAEPLARLERDGSLPAAADLTGSPEVPPSHATYIPVSNRDTFQAFCAGGCGLGDPLMREPWRVAKDVADEVVTPDVADRVYGVVFGPGGEVDENTTERRRGELRAERLGREPERTPEPMLEYRSPLLVRDGSFGCGHCDHDLGPSAGNWKDAAATRAWPLAERAPYLGIYVRPRRDPAMWLWEFYCPGCATLLEANIYEEGEQPAQDIHLGATSSEAGDPL